MTMVMIVIMIMIMMMVTIKDNYNVPKLIYPYKKLRNVFVILED